ncbi:MAG: GGDEF domain-containing protein [bacterium]
MKILQFFSNFPKTIVITISIIIALLVAAVGYRMGHDLSLSLFCLFPIILITWNLGKSAGIFSSFMYVSIWLTTDLITLHKFQSIAIPFINEILRLLMFLIISNIIIELKHALEGQIELARTDPLTGILNRRAFFEFTLMEINKSYRFKCSISMIYIDIDNFKVVNDLYGHKIGDKILRKVSQSIRSNIRVIDIVARLGGDEFGILMAQTEERAAYAVASKLRERLLKIAKQNKWPVTFSFGVVTYKRTPESVDEIINKADSLMYCAKKNGKDMIKKEVIKKPFSHTAPIFNL